MKKELIEKIKSRGYWRINFQPLKLNNNFKMLSETKYAVYNNRVRLRGWDYPHFPKRSEEDTDFELCGNYCQGWITWMNHVEFWRMYKSKQFLHYLALREDWLEDDSWREKLAKEIKPGTRLGMVGSVIYQMTEVFEFLSRLGQSNIYDDGVHVSISLHNTRGRELWVEDPMRADFFQPYKISTNNLVFEEDFAKGQIVSESKELAFTFILQIFDSFGWENPSIEIIKTDQEKLLTGRI